jgi:hypothetical protein
VKRISIGKTIISSDTPAPKPTLDVTPDTQPSPPTPNPKPTPTLTTEEEQQIEQQAEAQLQDEVRKSLDSRGRLEKPALERQRSMSNPPPVVLVKKKEKDERLSLRIPEGLPESMRMPGGFD